MGRIRMPNMPNVILKRSEPSLPRLVIIQKKSKIINLINYYLMPSLGRGTF
jgi:hypothetical protein